MGKKIKFGILVIVLVGILVSTQNIYAQTGKQECEASGGKWYIIYGGNGVCSDNATYDRLTGEMSEQKGVNLTQEQIQKSMSNASVDDDGLLGWLVTPLFKGIGYILMKFSALILTLVGKLFDFIIDLTIVEMGDDLNSSQPLGKSVGEAWGTIRDVANMCFIFVLLYAAFKSMFELKFGNLGVTVRNIIIVALIINFSLFFTKVVIDASNIVSIGFYNSIRSNESTIVQAGKEKTDLKGISAAYMNVLGLQGVFGAKILESKLDSGQILITGIMGSLFLLITAVIFLISSVMFMTRYILLIFIMILSPLALIAFIIPGQKKHFDQWLDALKNQSFFAPLFFALTWVVLKLAKAPGFLGDLSQTKDYTQVVTSLNTNVISLVVNYVLVIGMAIAALIFSKQMASKTMGFSAISGVIGTATIGGTAWASRNTLGRGMKAASDSSWLKNAATSNKWYSGAARAGLATASKGAGSSFDLRSSKTLGKVPGLGGELGILGKGSGKGGYAKSFDEKVKARAKYAKDVLGQTQGEKDQAKKYENVYNIAKYQTEKKIKTERLKEAQDELSKATTNEEKNKAQAKIEYIKNVLNKKNIFDKDDYKKYTPEWEDSKEKIEYEKYANAGTRRQEEYAKKVEQGSPVLTSAGAGVGGTIGAAIGSVAGPIGTMAGMTIGATAGGIGGKILGGKVSEGIEYTNKKGEKKKISFKWKVLKASAGSIRGQIKAPSKEKALADAYKAIADSETTPEETPATPTGGTPSSGAPVGGGGTPAGGGGTPS